MCNLYIPPQNRSNSTQIILKESGKKILQMLGKKNKQSFINEVAPNLHQKMLSQNEIKLDWCIYYNP